MTFARWAFFVAILSTGCVTAPRVQRPASGLVEEGLASWYGEPYHGRRAASGEMYNMHDLTGAHRTLPFGTKVLVTNLENQRQVVVTINDRGPFVPGRIIDLSQAAARKIGMLEKGVVPVRLEVLQEGDGMVKNRCWEVQVGAFSREDNVNRALARLREKGFSTRTAPAGGGLTRVRITGIAGLRKAQEIARALARDFPGALPVPCPNLSGGKP